MVINTNNNKTDKTERTTNDIGLARCLCSSSTMDFYCNTCTYYLNVTTLLLITHLPILLSQINRTDLNIRAYTSTIASVNYNRALHLIKLSTRHFLIHKNLGST